MKLLFNLALMSLIVMQIHAFGEHSTNEGKRERAHVSQPLLVNVHSHPTATNTSLKIGITKIAANEIYDFLKYGTTSPTSVPISRPELLKKGGITCFYESDAKSYICEFVITSEGEIRGETKEEQIISAVALTSVSQAEMKTKMDSKHPILIVTLKGTSAEDIYNLLRYKKIKPDSVSAALPEVIEKGALRCSYSRGNQQYSCEFAINKNGVAGIPE